jgi:hypothetical protein
MNELNEKELSIIEMFNNNCEDYEDKSTPFVIQLTADMCEVDFEDVIDALSKQHDLEEL